MTTNSPDTLLFLLINRHLANFVFDAVMPFLSSHGYLLISPFFIYMLVAGILSPKDRRKERVVWSILTIAVASAAAFLVDWADPFFKTAIGRIRPCRALNEVRLLVPCPPSHSMPSGHAMTSFAFAAPLYWLTKNYINGYVRFCPLLLASLIAFSRVYVGVHYPSDVLIGAFLGACIGMLLSHFLIMTKKGKNKLNDCKGS